MKLVYIAHPVGADTPEGIRTNLESAANWAAWAATRGFSPMTPYVAMAMKLDERNPYARYLGLVADLEAVRRADEVWLCGGRVSPGMFLEALVAYEANVPVWRWETMERGTTFSRTELFRLVDLQTHEEF